MNIRQLLSSLILPAGLLLGGCNTTPESPNPASATVLDSFGANPLPTPSNAATQFSWTIYGKDLVCTLDIDNNATIDYTVQNCSSQSRIEHTYGVQGTYTARLTVTGADLRSLSKTLEVTVTAPNTPPVPALRAGPPSTPTHPFDMVFYWTVQDADADITHCRFDAESDGVWEYDDLCSGLPALSSTSQVGTNSLVSHTYKFRYAKKGRYKATVEAADRFSKARAQTEVRVPYNTPPRIDFLNGLGRPDRSAQVRFGASDEDGDAISCTLIIESVGRFHYPKCREMRRDFFFAKAGRFGVTLEVSDPYTTTRKSTTIDCSVDCNYYALPQARVLGGPFTVTAQDTADDTWMVTADGYGTLKLYQRNSLNQWETLPGYWLVDPTDTSSGLVESVSLNPGASLVAVATTYDTVQIWARNGQSLTKVQDLGDHTDDVLTVDFNHDGTLLASGSSDGTIRLYTVSGNTATYSMELFDASSTTPAGVVRDLYFDHESNLLASGHDSNKAIIWNNLTTTPTSTEIAHSHAVKGVAINPAYAGPTTPFLATSSNANSVRLWNLDGTENGTAVSLSSPGLLSFSSDGSLLAVKDPNYYSTAMINLALREVVGFLSTNTSGQGRPLFGLNDTQLIVSNSHSIGLWRVTGPGTTPFEGFGILSQPQLLGPRASVWRLAIHPQSDLLVVADKDENLQLFDLENGSPIGPVVENRHSQDFYAVAFHPDGSMLASGDQKGEIHFWSVSPTSGLQSSHQIVDAHPENGSPRWVNTVAYSPQGNLLASGGDDNKVRIWDPQSGNLIRTLDGHTNDVLDLVWAPDGSWLASASDDKTIRIWDTRTGQTIHHLTDHTGWVYDLDVSPDGSQLVSGSQDKTVRLWDVATGQALGAPIQLSDWVFAVAWSPDGKVIATGDDDGLVRLWDPKTRQNVVDDQLVDRGKGSAEGTTLAFAPSGRYLVVGSESRSVTVFIYSCQAN